MRPGAAGGNRMANNEVPKYEQYWQLAQWFFKSPEDAEAFIRAHGTLKDFERHHLKVLALVEREERRQWLRKASWEFFKVFVAIGAGLVTLGAAFTALRGLTAWFGS